MSLVVAGLSHHTAPVELIERAAIAKEAVPHALHQLSKQIPHAGIVILSTCNRVELYVNHSESPETVERTVRRWFEKTADVPETELRHALYVHRGNTATAGHLFRVVSSIDSMVVGETEILGQVHDAYLAAQAEQTTDKVINVMFQRAFTVAKRVRTQTRISSGKVSVSSIAVDLASSIFMDLDVKTVLVIGSGNTAELTLDSLTQRGVRNVVVANRSPERAEALASRYGGRSVALENVYNELSKADIVVGSTSAPGYVLWKEQFARALEARNQEPIFVIDIAVPRDVDPETDQLDNVYLYDLDDLKKVARQNLELRRREVAECLEIIDNGVQRFSDWIKSLEAEPAIAFMTQELDAIRRHELDKTLDALPGLTETQRLEIENLSKRIVNTILQRPMSQIKREITHHDPRTVLHLVKRLFGLEES